MELLCPQECCAGPSLPEPWDGGKCACRSRATPPPWRFWWKRACFGSPCSQCRATTLQPPRGWSLLIIQGRCHHHLGVLQPPAQGWTANSSSLSSAKVCKNMWLIQCMHMCYRDQCGFWTSPGDFAAGTGLRAHVFNTPVNLTWWWVRSKTFVNSALSISPCCH